MLLLFSRIPKSQESKNKQTNKVTPPGLYHRIYRNEIEIEIEKKGLLASKSRLLNTELKRTEKCISTSRSQVSIQT